MGRNIELSPSEAHFPMFLLFCSLDLNGISVMDAVKKCIRIWKSRFGMPPCKIHLKITSAAESTQHDRHEDF